MTRIRSLGGLSGLVLLLVAASASAQQDGDVDVVEKDQGAVESFFYEVWSRVQSMTPNADRPGGGEERVTVTAGLRGAEGEEKAMEPYWKGGIAEDPDFREEVRAYRKALKEGRKGNPDPLSRFLNEHGDSDLAANARFALGMAYADSGNARQAREVLESFRQNYPEHPLSDDAKAVMARLSG